MKKKEHFISTAEEFIKDLQTEQGEQEYTMLYKIDISKKMIEFAKLHVEAALKEALNNARFDNEHKYHPVPKSIINAYPLTNIK